MLTDIETALRQSLPADLHHHVPTLVQLLAEASGGTISPTDAEARLGMLQDILHALEGKRIATPGAVIDFGRDNDQRGMSVTISGDVAGGNIIKLTVPVVNQNASGSYIAQATDGGTATVRHVETGGGDYAEGNIDKRQGAFVSGGTIYGNVIGQQTIYQPLTSTLTPQQKRNRSRMLDKVEQFWVKDVLEQSLYQVARIELGLEQASGQVHHPWESIVQRGNQPPILLPAGKPMIEVFDDFHGELLILGMPGAGKTTMLLELTRDLIFRARNDDSYPIPVVFNLSTWTGKQQPLEKWLIEELNQRYGVNHRIAQEWVKTDAILPLLDGLDEVVTNLRSICVDFINEYRCERGFIPMTVCSRMEDYTSLTQKLKLENAIILQVLTKEQVDKYLKLEPFKNVQVLLQDEEALRSIIDTPLMLSIVVMTYKDTFKIKRQIANSLIDQRRWLFDNYIAAMFVRSSRSNGGLLFAQQQTLIWLSWLAKQMVQYNNTVLYIERIQPNWLPHLTRRRYVVSTGLLSGLGFGLSFGVLACFLGILLTESGFVKITVLGWIPIYKLFGQLTYNLSNDFGLPVISGVGLGISTGLFFGLTAALYTGLSSYSLEIKPVETGKWSWVAAGGGWRSSVFFAFGGSLLTGLMYRFAFLEIFTLIPAFDIVSVFTYLLYTTPLFALPFWIIGWLIGEITGEDICNSKIFNNRLFIRMLFNMVITSLCTGSLGYIYGLITFRYDAFISRTNYILSNSMSSAIIGFILGGLFFNVYTYNMLERTVERSRIHQAARKSLVCGLIFGLGSVLITKTRFGTEIYLFEWITLLHTGLIFGLVGGTFGWLINWVDIRNRTRSTKLYNYSLRRFARNTLSGGLLIGLGTNLFIRRFFEMSNDPQIDIILGLGSGLICGLFAGLNEVDITVYNIPNEGIHRSLRSAIVGGLVFILIFLCIFALIFGSNILGNELSGTKSNDVWVWQAIFGLFIMFLGAFCIVLLYGGTTVLQHYTLRLLFYHNRSLPLSLISFLDYCTERIFLRKVGGGYIFVHRMLMEHFASLGEDGLPQTTEGDEGDAAVGGGQ